MSPMLQCTLRMSASFYTLIRFWIRLTEWPEGADLSVAKVPCKVREFIRSRLRCDPEVSVGFYFGIHETDSLCGKHAVERAEGSVDGTYDERPGVMRCKLYGCCMVDFVAVLVITVQGKLCLPSIELLHQRLGGAHRESAIATQCSDCLQRTSLV